MLNLYTTTELWHFLHDLSSEAKNQSFDFISTSLYPSYNFNCDILYLMDVNELTVEKCSGVKSSTQAPAIYPVVHIC